MSKIEQFKSMDGYTFDEGVALLVLVKAPFGMVNYLKTTHNRSHLHSEIHKQLRMPGVQRILKENGYYREEPTATPEVPESVEGPTKEESSAPASLIAGTDPQSPNEEGQTEELPESDKKLPNSEQNFQNSHENGEESNGDDTDIILTKHDVRTHEHTRYEDMPTDITRELWLKRQDLYREMQQAHLKMRSVPEGEEHNEERAKWRAEVLRLDEEIDGLWALIDAEIERFENEKEGEEKKSDEKPGFDVSTYRSYISKALRKKSLTDAQRVELQHRVEALLKAGAEFKPETLEKLKAIGVSTE